MNRRRRRMDHNLRWDGRSKSWPRPHEPGPPGGDLNLWMCAEDLGTEIWTHFHRLERGRGTYEREPVTVTGCSEELAETLANSLPYTHDRESLSSAVKDFAKVVAQELVLTGDISFEIQIGRAREGHVAISEARLGSIPRRSLVGVRPLLFQVVPSDAPGGLHEKRMTRLDASRVVTFRTPRRWRASFSAVQRGFRVLGRSEDTWMREGAEGRFTESVKEVRRQYNIHLARLSAPIGWNFRGRIREQQSDFHWALRELQWKRVCIDVRDEILSALRGTFKSIGELVDERPLLEWRDLPTREQVDAGLQRLGQGARFDEVLKAFR
jgi:hypothetical protein